MNNVKLKTAEYDFNGKTYILRCNMNVLADVQEEFGGKILEAVNSKATVKSCLAFLAAMLNDYADEMGWAERYTQKQVGRLLAPSQLHTLHDIIMPLVVSAMSSDESEDGEKNG